jgi:preprotein translocase SecE subunit
MARRDRKRKRNQGKPGTQPGGSRARDMGLDDPSIDEAGIGDTTAAPDPLKQSSAEVDQAKAAETGAYRPPPGEPVEAGQNVLGDEGESDYVAAPDEVQNDLLPGARGQVDPAIAAERAAAARPRKDRGRVLTFLRNVVEELRRVQWPDRRHTGQATAVTLGFVVVAGAFLGLMDAIWRPIINAII